MTTLFAYNFIYDDGNVIRLPLSGTQSNKDYDLYHSFYDNIVLGEVCLLACDNIYDRSILKNTPHINMIRVN